MEQRRPEAKPARKLVGDQPDGGVLVTTNQNHHADWEGPACRGVRVRKIWPRVVVRIGSLVAVLTTARRCSFTKPDGTLQGSVAVKPGPLGLAWQPDGSTVYASGEGGADLPDRPRREANGRRPRLPAIDPAKKGEAVFQGGRVAGQRRQRKVEAEAQGGPAGSPGLAVSPDGRRLYAALGISNAVSVIDPHHQEQGRRRSFPPASLRIASPSPRTARPCIARIAADARRTPGKPPHLRRAVPCALIRAPMPR